MFNSKFFYYFELPVENIIVAPFERDLLTYNCLIGRALTSRLNYTSSFHKKSFYEYNITYDLEILNLSNNRLKYIFETEFKNNSNFFKEYYFKKLELINSFMIQKNEGNSYLNKD